MHPVFIFSLVLSLSIPFLFGWIFFKFHDDYEERIVWIFVQFSLEVITVLGLPIFIMQVFYVVNENKYPIGHDSYLIIATFVGFISLLIAKRFRLGYWGK